MLMKNKTNIKSDITIVKKYLIKSFYNDSDIKYTIKKINKNTNVNKDTIKLVIDMLKRKKLIENRYEFKLTLESVEFLENNLKNFKSYIYTIIAIFLSIYSLSYSVSAIIITNSSFFILYNVLILLVITFFMVIIYILEMKF